MATNEHQTHDLFHPTCERCHEEMFGAVEDMAEEAPRHPRTLEELSRLDWSTLTLTERLLVHAGDEYVRAVLEGSKLTGHFLSEIKRLETALA